MLLDPNRVDGQMHVLEKRTISAMRIERVPTPGELFLNGQWVRVMGSRMVNELRLSQVNEDLMVGDRSLFDGVSGYRIFDVGSRKFVGLKGRDQLDFGSGQMHPDYLAGPHATPSGASVHTTNFTDLFSYTPANHTLKLGVGASKNGARGTISGCSSLRGTVRSTRRTRGLIRSVFGSGWASSSSRCRIGVTTTLSRTNGR
jgi:hypothetical protein